MFLLRVEHPKDYYNSEHVTSGTKPRGVLNLSDQKEKGERKSILLLRNTAFAFLAIVIAQFWLGMTINLEVDLPVKQLGVFSTITYFGGFSGYILGHMILGILLLLLCLMFLVLSIRTKILALKITGVIALVAVIGAIVNGLLFLMSGQFFGWSIGMAMSAVSAIISIAVSLYYVGYHNGTAIQ